MIPLHDHQPSRPSRGGHRLTLLLLALACCSGALARDPGLPDTALTPGALNTGVSQATIGSTICSRGWTRLIRPPAGFTNSLKRLQIRKYGYENRQMRDYEEDHLVPLELGGAPQDPANLWPQPREGTWRAADKDKLESALRRRVCQGSLSLAEAQQMIRTDWIAAFGQLHLRRTEGLAGAQP